MRLRHAFATSLLLAFWLFVSIPDAWAQYVQRANLTTNGSVTFTGNTLGLDGATVRIGNATVGQNGSGTRGAIGTFITTDPALQDLVPAPQAGVPVFPPGTTSDWQQNGSAAELRLPLGARVLRAELIWGGSWASDQAGESVAAFIDQPITLTTPAGSFPVSPDPATSRTTGNLSGAGACTTSCFYVRTADVTALVQAGGTHVVSAVPATQSTIENNNNVAGWTLAVVYEDFNQPIRNLTLFLGLEPSGGAAAQVSGFCTPTSGTLNGRLAVSAFEGDARITGDRFLFGSTAPLTDANRIFGPRNPLNNFFAGQILDDSGQLDTAGTFGTLNHTAGSPVAGVRQGWDITNVSVTSQLLNNQTTAFAQGTTTGDGYRIAALALQIDIGAPRFRSGDAKSVDRVAAVLGDTITYTIVLDNTTGTSAAANVTFFDTPPAGTTFVPGSFLIDGVSQPGASPVTGVPMGAIAAGAQVTVSFQAQVTSIPPPPNQHLRTNRARWTFDFVSCAGHPVQQGANETNTVITEVPVADLFVSKTFVDAPAIAGAPVTSRVVVSNLGPSAVNGAVLTDSGTTPALTGVTWTCTPDPGASACTPASGVGPVTSSLLMPSGGGATFTITGTLPAGTPPGTITNTATIVPPTGVPELNPANNTATAAAPIAGSADLRVTKAGPATGTRGGNITYSVVVFNDGPSDAQGVVVSDPSPPGLTLVTPPAGPCAAPPGCVIPAGGSQTLTVTFGIPPDYAGPDPISNTATASSATANPNTTNDAGVVTTALDAPVADLAISKTNNATTVTPGGTATYTITVTNAGPATAIGARVLDVFSPSIFTSVQWQCAASGVSSCTVPGPQTGNIDTLVTVGPGAANNVTLTAQVVVNSSLTTGEVTNTATVTAPAGSSDPTSANNSATDTDAIAALADLAVTNTGPDPVTAGTSVQYTHTVTNNGPSTARNVPIATQMFEINGLERPDLIDGLDAPPGIACELRPFFSPVTLLEFLLPVCVIPELAPGASISFTQRVTLPADLQVIPPPGQPEAVVSLAFLPQLTQPDPDPNNDAAFFGSLLASEADLTVTKVGPSSVLAGSQVSYTVRVVNNGVSTARNVVIQDPVPAGLVLLQIHGVCATGLPCTIPTLAPGEGVDLLIDLLVPEDYSGPITVVNTASAQSDTADPNAADNTASASTLVIAAQADLSIAKTGPSSVAPGGLLTYDVAILNSGPSIARNLVLLDVLPGGTTFVSLQAPPAATVCDTLPSGDGGVIRCRTTALGDGETLTYRIVVQAHADLRPRSILTNVAVASAPTPDLNIGNDRAQVDTIVAAPTEADLVLTKSDAPDPVIIGSDITYTLTIANLGPAPATAVTLTDTLSAGLTLVSATPSQGTCAGATCSLGSMPAGATASVTLVASATGGGVLTNSAVVTATETDPVPANNTVGQVTTTSASADEADLVVEKFGPSVAPPGQALVYHIRVTNRGPATATFVELTDTLPPGLTFFSNTGACTSTFPCTIDTLAPGESRTVTNSVLVDPALAVPAVVTNTVTIQTQSVDPNPANNTSSVTTDIQPATDVDLSVVKTDSPDAVLAGGYYTYALTVLNRGPATATNVIVRDVLPAGLTDVTATPTRGTCTVTTEVTCEFGVPIPAGNYSLIAIRARAPLDLPVPNPMVNTATITSDQTDSNPADNSSTQPTTVVPAGLDLTVGANLVGPQPLIGDTATVRLTVTNVGVGDATGVIVSGLLSSALRLVSATPSQGLFDATTGQWTVGAVPAVGAAPTLDLVFVLNLAAQSVTGALTAVDQPDTVPGNNQSLLLLPGNAWSTFLTDLKLDASANVPAVTAGGQVTFSTASINHGPTWAQDLVLSGTLPAGLAFVSASPSPGAVCTFPAPGASGVVTCRWPDVTVLEFDARRSLAVIAEVDAAAIAGTELITRFETSSATGEYYPPDNVRHVRLSVDDGQGGDLGVLVATTGAPAALAEAIVAVGDPVAVRIVVSNTGAVATNGRIRVDSPDPAALQVVSASISQGSGQPAGAGGLWDIGVLAPGASAEARLIVRLLTVEAVTIVAERIASTPADLNADNDVAAVVIDGTGAGNGGRWTAAGNIDGLGGGEIVAGAGFGETPIVRVFTGAGIDTGLGFYAFDRRFRGGVRVATCDIDGDGRDEIVAGAGPGGGPHVRVLRARGQEIAEIAGFYAFEAEFPGGIFVACTDVEGDGRQELVVSADAGRAPEVRVFTVTPTSFTLVSSWLAYEPTFAGGVRVSDSRLMSGLPFNVLTTPGPGRTLAVRAWQVGTGTASIVGELPINFLGGGSAAVADIDVDGTPDLLVTPDAGSPAVVRRFSAISGQLLGEAIVYPPSFLGGVRFSLGLLDGGPGVPEFIAGQGPGGTPRIQTYYIGAGGAPVKRLDFLAIEVP
jgi:uncharacterized repeat protein (TIGR01451 family)